MTSPTAIKDDRGYKRLEAVNDYGVQIVRSGQRVGDPFFSSVVACYTNLLHSPILTIFYSVLIISCIADVFRYPGPPHLVSRYIDENQTHFRTIPFIDKLTQLLKSLCHYVILYQQTCIALGLFVVPLLRKPSKKSFYLFSFLAFVYLIFYRSITYLEILVMSQSYLLVIELRNPIHKSFVTVCSITFFALYFMTTTTYTTMMTDFDKHVNSSHATGPHHGTFPNGTRFRRDADHVFKSTPS